MEPKDPLLDQPVELPGEDSTSKQLHVKKRHFPALPYKKIGTVLVGAVLIGAVVALVMTLTSKKKDSPSSAASLQTSATTQQSLTTADVPEAVLTESYTSDPLRISLNYPKTWKVTEENSGMRIESPEFTYRAKTGEVAGKFRIYVRKGARDIDSKYIGRGYAVKPSEKLVYTAPEVGQRSETYLTSFGLDTPDNFAFFLIAGNYNLQKSDTLGPNYGKEIDAYIIGGGYVAQNAPDDLATSVMSIESYDTTNAYKQAIEILKSFKLR